MTIAYETFYNIIGCIISNLKNINIVQLAQDMSKHDHLSGSSVPSQTTFPNTIKVLLF